ncbi:MAG: methyltransferase domain-containing protein [Gemmatimonadaceae bacterium]|nr:methyltransferase domain-containing protein [Gemmatimonadaceae bacterium]
MFTPARARGHEMLDDPDADPALALRSLRDVALANRLFGGRRAVLTALNPVWRESARAGIRTLTLLDVGTGLGDIPRAVTRAASRHGIHLRTVGLELSLPVARAASKQCDQVVSGSALALPLADRSIDLVTCSQVLHHFEDALAAQLLQECTRVARHTVVIGDLRRSWLAAAGLWAASYALGFHPVSRHDGMLSVRRGYTTDELRALVQQSTGCRPDVQRGLGFRVHARWHPMASAESCPTQ